MNVVLLFCCIYNFGFCQTISGGCDKVTVINFPGYPSNYYACCAWKLNDGVLCSDVLTYGHPAGVKMDLEKYSFSSGQWEIEVAAQNSNTSTVFPGLSAGKYRVKMYLPKRVYQSSCPENSIQVYNTLGQWIGWRAEYKSAPNHDAITNEIWVGEAEISSSDVAFNEYGNNPIAFDSGQVVKVFLTSNPRFSHWRGVIRDEQTLEEYQTGWFDINVEPGPFKVTEVWDDGGGDPFEAFKGYKATIWVTNHECPAWKSYNMNFFICPLGTGCRLRDQEVSLNFYPNPASDYIVLQGLDHLHQEDIIKASIANSLGQVVKQIHRLERTQIEVSDLTAGLYYFSIFRNDQKIATEKIVIQ